MIYNFDFVFFRRNKAWVPEKFLLQIFLYKNAPTHFVPLDKINECKFLGSILRFDDLVDCDLKWNGNYGSNIVCDGVCSVLVSFDIKPRIF